MRRFVTLNCLVDCNDLKVQRSDAVQDLRRAVIAPALYTPGIQQALKRANFRFHRTCSYASLIQECDVGEGRTLLMFWGFGCSDSRVTVSMSGSSCSSTHLMRTCEARPGEVPPAPPAPPASPTAPAPPAESMRERELRHTAQQTEISCRLGTGANSPINLADAEELVRGHARGPVTAVGAVGAVGAPAAAAGEAVHFTSPASSLLQPRSMSILGSVCALLLNKQGSTQAQGPKEVPSYTGASPGTPDTNICRICFGGESAERLVRPCDCRGTIAAVHRSCLERWLLQAATSYCELCRHHYVVTRSHKWSWLMSLCAWAISGRGRALLADAWRGVALGACSVLGTARALHACDAVLQAGARRGGGAALAANLFSSLLIGVIGALNGLLTTWMLLKIQEHQMSWQAWRDSTLHVRVTLDDDSQSPAALGDSDVTIVAGARSDNWSGSTAERSTNIADPFMVTLPYTLDRVP